MTSFKLNLTVVGVFVLAAVTTLIVALAILAGRTGDTDMYYTEYGNVADLKYGTQVLYEGYPVGQVQRIVPHEKDGRVRFRVEFTVAAGWKIPDDSVARSASSGLLAPQTISIKAGTSPTNLAPGAMVRPGETPDLLSSFSSVAGNVDVLTQQGLLPLIDNLNRQVTALGQIIDKDLRPLVADAAVVVDSAEKRVPPILANVEGVSANLDGASRQLAVLLSNDRVARLDRLLDSVDRAARDMGQAMQQLHALTAKSGPDLQAGIAEFRLTMEALSRRSESFAQNLDTSSRNLADFSRQLRQNPGLLLGGRKVEEQEKVEPPMKEGSRP